ncbi:type VII secretion protein EssC [Peribacillus asahii]|uniref:type VII secretion protein EssC n=1 Tax=Peribacillus asahii TaxID=228899 RepID=UPI000FD9B0FC|nr:type VII secretion protein EssC [Peribacillus asahii]USK84004.1 type VII secretion protein EssC [Peribacillus asahii]
MSNLWLFYDQYYQRVPLSKGQQHSLTVGPEAKQMITLRHYPFTEGPITIEVEESGFSVWRKGSVIGRANENHSFQLKEQDHLLTIFLTVSDETVKTYYLGYQSEITYSSFDNKAEIFHSNSFPIEQTKNAFTLFKVGNGWVIEPGMSNLYLNGKRVPKATEVKVGDLLLCPFMTFQLLEDDVLEIKSIGDYETELPIIQQPQSVMSKKYPMYRRTPRMVYELPKEKVFLSFPVQESEDSNRGLWLIIMPPLIMLIVMGIVALIQPRGIFIIISMVMFMTTLVTSTVQFFKDKGTQKKRKERRRRIYTHYLENKRNELLELSEKQKEVLHFHFPSFEKMKYLTEQLSDRLWERSLDSYDLLQFRIGKGTVPASYQISINSGDMANREMDDLLEQSQQMENVYREIEDVPVVADLSKGTIGLIGKENVVKNELHQIIGQLAFFHSYHDVRMVFIFDEEEYSDWEWMKWLPHFQLPHVHAKGLIYNEKTRDQLLSSIYEMLRERDSQEDKEKTRFSPHLVFIIANQQLITDHVILEYLEGEHPSLGLSVIFAAEAKESLTEHIHTLVRYINDEEGDILIQDKKAVSIPFRLDAHQQKGNEKFARLLKTLNHQVGVTNSIPNSVSFLQMMHMQDVAQLPIKQNWLTNESAKSLAAPIGLKGKKDVVELNLHEKAHGPHGLLAGTTGSGKSEFLQTYILSLAVHFHPHEVAFLLIDYKGGGMAQPFKNMPHLLGTITNIEGSKNFSERALASIKSELKKRQRLFDEYQVNHIDDYTDLYKQGRAKDPLPHLFLISDEFAELKSEEPDFIRELVSAARIGRSLGVHLILATQKPGGVIDEQIWSNARFKVALKVQDANDSREILKNGDAATITETGRGYLQVGNNEVYELFQSAWSGSPYLEDTSQSEDEIALVTDLGLIPLSNVTTHDRKKTNKKTEIEAIVEKIEGIQAEMGIEKLPSPWLPPLAHWISRKSYRASNRNEISFALVDEPEKQSQTAFHYDVLDDGNIGIFGSSGYGKSYTVITLLLSMAERFSPEEMYYYLFDFGNGTLLPLKQLPHTADFFLMDEGRKIEKFMNLLKGEIAQRKQLFQQQEVNSIKMFNQLSDEKLPLLFIAIDNFDLIKEEMQELEAQITQFARDGQSLGIYMIFTATRINAVRQPLMNNLKTKIVHYLMDSGEAYSILGRIPFTPEPIPGRAIIRKDESYFSQVFLPTEGKDDYEVLESIKQDVQLLKAKYEGLNGPKPVPMLPSELTMLNFTSYIGKAQTIGKFPIGLDEESVQPVYIDFAKNKHCIVLGPAQKGKTNVLKVLVNSLINQGTESVGIFDSFDRGLSSYSSEQAVTYLETKEQITDWLSHIEHLLAGREQDYLANIQQGPVRTEYSPIVLVIDGYSRFSQSIDSLLQDRISKLMKNYSHLGFHVFVSGSNNDLTKGYDSLTVEIKQIRQAVVLMKKSEQTLFTLSYERKEEEIYPGYGYYVINGKETKIQIPLCSTETRVYL